FLPHEADHKPTPPTTDKRNKISRISDHERFDYPPPPVLPHTTTLSSSRPPPTCIRELEGHVQDTVR
ncbi:hypothetical protein BaRGS_00032800, partial [Batillaria attramentaria]